MDIKYNVVKLKDSSTEEIKDFVSVEEPLEMYLKYKVDGKWETDQLSITMRTPGNDEDLISGFLFNERIIENFSDIENIEKDLRVDTYRSSGAGGQHVNTTDSAVRITHIPTKIVVQCQNERSQHKNKETCMNMLRARLYEHELQKREKQNENIESSKSDIGWGHQIRSYVLHPYQMVKDNRTNFESSNPEKILDGEIDNFLESSLYKINA